MARALEVSKISVALTHTLGTLFLVKLGTNTVDIQK